MNRPRRPIGSKFIALLPSTSELDWVGNQHHAPATFPWERPSTHWIGSWVGPRAGLDGCGKSCPPPGFDPQTVQPVASRHTDCAIPAPTSLKILARTWAGQMNNQDSISRMAKAFISAPSVQIRPGAQSASNSMGTRGYFLDGKGAGAGS